MSTTSEPHLSCHHTGYEFDWWRCKEGGYVGRPPSPFPASFESTRPYRPDSSDPRCGIDASNSHGATNTDGIVPNDSSKDGPGSQSKEEHEYLNGGNDVHRLYWPLCQGPGDAGLFQTKDFGNVDTLDFDNKPKKTPRLAHKRPPWIPTTMPNKWGVTGHPPPYTNYCKETLFNTRIANPAKVTIRTTF